MIRTKKSVKAIASATVVIGDDAFTLGTENLTLLQSYPANPEEPTREQWMRLAETSPGLDFWKNPEEDVYTDTDGEPI